MKVLVASLNPVKVDACQQAFTRFFPDEEIRVSGEKTPSGVSEQPFSEAETLGGAVNRAELLRSQNPDADYVVGIEGGVEQRFDELWAFAWVVVSNGSKSGKGTTARFPLPGKVKELLDEGLELGDANDQVFSQHNSKQQGGAIGLLTGDLITRKELYVPAVIMALIPFRKENTTLYAE
ncbi:MAG TPA: inosine/xanthosine triphosphatase [Bacteroidales bacterium]|nr:inosine/xanthosine triphosphatase [Bacteroidales bacterium]